MQLSKLLFAGFLLLFFYAPYSQAQTAVVNWTNLHQQIDGWGASDWGTAENISSAQADLFFSPSSGIGLGFVRTLGNEECNNTISDQATLTQAVARGAQVWLTMQSPPISMKTGGSTCGLGSLDPSNYSAYASYIATWVQNLQTDGISVYAVSPVNEPDVATSSAPSSCTSGTGNNIGGFCMTPAQLDAFIPILYSALSSAGLSTKIIAAEEGQWFLYNYPSTCMTDSSCAPDVGILASHGYGWYPGNVNDYGLGATNCCSTVTVAPEALSTGQLWQSEVSENTPFNGSINEGLGWARNIHDYLTTANVTGWMYWMLNGDNWGGGSCGDNEGLTDCNNNPAKRLYVIGQWSKFVRPGYYRIDSTTNPQAGIYVTAFNDASTNNLVIVAVNASGSDVSQSFSVTNAPSLTAATPWITSADLNLVQQSAVSISGNNFTYALPAYSVTTFVGTTTGSAGSSAPAAPTGLTATVFQR